MLRPIVCSLVNNLWIHEEPRRVLQNLLFIVETGWALETVPFVARQGNRLIQNHCKVETGIEVVGGYIVFVDSQKHGPIGRF